MRTEAAAAGSTPWNRNNLGLALHARGKLVRAELEHRVMLSLPERVV